ncbi:DUF4394 domain-containing protein [Tautonia sociabilis]|uniref:DUF4394 domain-containing protein n=1 Tax=Tautonia sociabilis TaxID=2080755 RepID=A0A432MHH0_9BACT|nr:DUF4394 domain-containing protein [Tautonia sociabilis]RUL86751.1 DUF4394 domain-containing protein [Tautonia sociabilis]
MLLAQTFVVDSALDAVQQDGRVTLREALIAAVTNSSPNADLPAGDPGLDTILFTITDPPNGPYRIQLDPNNGPLPAITDPVVIDGYSAQPGASRNTLATGSNAVVLIEVVGTNGTAPGLALRSAGNTISGLALNGFSTGIDVVGSAASGNVISGNLIGLSPDGARGGNARGIVVDAPSNTIGGTNPGDRNVISANFSDGIVLGARSSATLVAGNLVGTDLTGTLSLGNGQNGIRVVDSPDATIGGIAAGAGNVISGNGQAGIELSGLATVRSLVQGNRIGTDAGGSTALGNGSHGLWIRSGASGATVGGTNRDARNVISGNALSGITLADPTTSGHLISGNTIGLDLNEFVALPNQHGITIDNAPGNTVGGAFGSGGNLISGNSGAGVVVTGASAIGNLLASNRIGTAYDFLPTSPANLSAGVSLRAGASGNTVGGVSSADGNSIRGNGGAGVEVLGASSTGNAILGNAILQNVGLGIDLGGDGPTPNDPGDADLGPNALQNAPVLTSVAFVTGVSAGLQVRVDGTLSSLPNLPNHIEIFLASTGADGRAQGDRLLGVVSTTTDANGLASFTATFPFDVSSSGDVLTATATDPSGNTSEFSSPLELPGLIGFESDTYRVQEDVVTGGVVVSAVRTRRLASAVAVNYAVTGGTASPGADFQPVSGTLSFASGQRAASVFIPIANDALLEGFETIELTLSSPTGGTALSSTAATTVFLLDDDRPDPDALAISNAIQPILTFRPSEEIASSFLNSTDPTNAPIDEVLGGDIRPRDGKLYLISRDSSIGALRLFRVDIRTGDAVPVGPGPIPVSLSGGRVGIDFDPAADRLRVVSESGQNLLIRPDGTLDRQDGTLRYAAGDPNATASPRADGLAIASAPGGGSSTAFVIDSSAGVLAVLDGPSGTLQTVGALGFRVIDTVFGFDLLPGDPFGYALIAADGAPLRLFTIDLATGQASPAGVGAPPVFGSGGLALVPRGPIRISPVGEFEPASRLASALAVPGTGLAIDLPASTYLGGFGQAGYSSGFSLTDGTSSVAIPAGIVLTSGSSRFASEPNASPTRGASLNRPGDSAVTDLISLDTHDANSLTIRFTADPGILSVQFQLVFASEEFFEYVNRGVNDTFAAFLDGVQISTDRLGRPLTVDNNFFLLNNSGNTTDPNTAGTTPVNFAFQTQYDGLTPLLVTEAALNPNVAVHTLTLTIADAGDGVLDSAVFLSRLRGLDRLPNPTGPPTDLVVAKSAPTEAAVGETIGYTVTVTNAGQATASGVVVSDLLPSGFQLSGVTSSKGSASSSGGQLIVSVGDLAPGEVVTVTITGSASAPGTLVNTASVSSDTPDTEPANDSASTTTVVVSAGSVVVVNTEDQGPGSLRQAILETNRLPGLQTITFAIPGAGIPTIRPLSALPPITDPVIIDGLTQPGHRVELDGSLAGPGVDGLVVLAGGTLIAGLAINRFGGSGIVLVGGGDNRILGNVIGVDTSGTIRLGNGRDGITVLDSSGNTIAGNLLSGNQGHGLSLSGSGTTGTLVIGNTVGTTADGSGLLGNSGAGILIGRGSSGNTVGGPDPGRGNLLSGNRIAGLVLLGPVPGQNLQAANSPTSGVSSGNLVVGNQVGVSAGSSGVLANGLAGILVSESPGNTIGGLSTALGNVIAGGIGDGIALFGTGSSGNLVLGNAVGTRPGGRSSSLGGTGNGVVIASGARDNTVGGDSPGAGNVVSASAGAGVLIATGASGNLVAGNVLGAVGLAPGHGVGLLIQTAASHNVARGNRIGGNTVGLILNPTASANLVVGNTIGAGDALGTPGNGFAGLIVRESADNTIGGTAPEQGNVLSGNGLGLLLEGIAATGNLVLGNLIGLDASGRLPVPNATDGILIENARGNTIGGPEPGAGNVISANASTGVHLLGRLASSNVVAGNAIGARIDQPPAGNLLVGVYIEHAPGNTIGGVVPGAGNLITGNGVVDVQLTGTGASGNLVAGNLIGTGPLGDGSPRAAGTGIFLDGAPGNTIGGFDPGASNLISGHDAAGIHLVGPTASGNRILGNRIGTDRDGTVSIGNQHGITLDGSPNNTIGGLEPGAGNLISGNQLGLVIANQGASGNLVLGNLVGTDAAGLERLPNALGGIFIVGAPANTIGGPSAEAGNVISGNGGLGLQVFNLLAAGNVIAGNRIGVDRSASRPIPNGDGGIYINDAPSGTVGGASPGLGNIIAANLGTGLVLSGPAAADTVIKGNIIGTPTETDPPERFGNTVGLFITGGAGLTRLSSSPDRTNTIRGNRVTNTLVIGGDSGPVVIGVDPLLDPSGAIGSIRISFSEDMDPRRVRSLANYRLNLGETGLGGLIQIAEASYDPDAMAVTLLLSRPIAADASFRLIVVGRPPGGLTSARNLRLDGNADGSPGDNFIAVFRRGQLLRAPARTSRAASAVSAAAVDSLFDSGAGLRVGRRLR